MIKTGATSHPVRAITSSNSYVPDLTKYTGVRGTTCSASDRAYMAPTNHLSAITWTSLMEHKPSIQRQRRPSQMHRKTHGNLTLTAITSITVATQGTISLTITLVNPAITSATIRTSNNITEHHGRSVQWISDLTVTSNTSENVNGESGQKWYGQCRQVLNITYATWRK